MGAHKLARLTSRGVWSGLWLVVAACCGAVLAVGCSDKAVATGPSPSSASSQRITIRGVVTDIATGKPIAGATVSTCSAGPGVPPGWVSCGQGVESSATYGGVKTTTDPSGAYSLTGVPAGVAAVGATSAGYNRHMEEMAPASVTSDLTRNLSLSPGWAIHCKGGGSVIVRVPTYYPLVRWGWSGKAPSSLLIRNFQTGAVDHDVRWPPTADNSYTAGSTRQPIHGPWEVIFTGSVDWAVWAEDNVAQSDAVPAATVGCQ